MNQQPQTHDYTAIKIDNCILIGNNNEKFIQSLPTIGQFNGSGFSEIPLRTNTIHHQAFFSTIIDKLLQTKSLIFIDIGAYVGSISLVLAKFLQNTRLDIKNQFYLFEPNFINYTCLNHSVTINNLKDINIVNAAVSDTTKLVGMSCPLNNSIAASISYNRTPDTMAISLDQYFMQNSVDIATDTKTIIKIDTEGHEPYVITGMLNFIQNNNPCLILEVHPYRLKQKVNGSIPLFSFLANNYHIFNIGNIGFPTRITMLDLANPENALTQACNRDKYSLTDILCIPKIYSIDFVLSSLEAYIDSDMR